MRKLNGKNKFYIAIFSVIILLIIGLLIVSLILSRKNLKTVYNVSSNSVVFDSETNLILLPVEKLQKNGMMNITILIKKIFHIE